MPSPLALALNAALVLWLLRRDLRLRELPSPALWIPAVWLTLVGSRAVSLWLAACGIYVGEIDNLEGSPLDMAVFLGLMVAAVLVLVHRGFDWGTFVRRNKVLIAIYLYLAVSALWSVAGIVSMKRAVKDFGHVLPALILLSEADPMKAMRVVYVRVSYLLFPLSVVLIKYFPNVGRRPSRSFDNLFTGVTLDKNSLGCTVFVFGLFLVIDIIEMRQRPGGHQKLDEWIRYGMLSIGIWLLLTCNSLTSMICLALACFLLWGTGRLLRTQNPKHMLFSCLAVIGCLAVLQDALDIPGMVSAAFARGDTMSGRTWIWELVKEQHTDPLFGCGFYSFWTTEGAKEISDLFMGTLNTVHNGLLEMYLDGGIIGLALLILLLLIWGRRSIGQLLEGTLRARLAAIFWLLAIVNNFSETGYFRFTPLWFTLLLLMIECPPSPQAMAPGTNITGVSAIALPGAEPLESSGN